MYLSGALSGAQMRHQVELEFPGARISPLRGEPFDSVFIVRPNDGSTWVASCMSLLSPKVTDRRCLWKN